jgi:hypothetical protein
MGVRRRGAGGRGLDQSRPPRLTASPPPGPSESLLERLVADERRDLMGRSVAASQSNYSARRAAESQVGGRRRVPCYRRVSLFWHLNHLVLYTSFMPE